MAVLRQLLLLCLLAASALGEEEGGARAVALERMTAADQQLLPAFEKTRDAAAAVADLMRQINAVRKSHTKDTTKEAAIFNELSDAAPLFWLLDAKLLRKTGEFETDVDKIRRALLAGYRAETMGADCFLPDGSYRTSQPCKAALERKCAPFGSSPDGVTVPVVTEELMIEDIPVTAADELEHIRRPNASPSVDTDTSSLATMGKALVERNLQFCRAAALSGEFFEASQVARYPTSPPMVRYFMGIYSEQRLREECFAFDVFEAQMRVASIKTRFPQLSSTKYWQQQVDRRANGCRAAVQLSCRNTYAIKEEILLAYLTKACEIREVTAEDVDNDIRDFAASGLTRADQIKHAQLKDTIALCKDAMTYGMTWSYIEPSKAGCTKPTAKAKAKKPPSKR